MLEERGQRLQHVQLQVPFWIRAHQIRHHAENRRNTLTFRSSDDLFADLWIHLLGSTQAKNDKISHFHAVQNINETVHLRYYYVQACFEPLHLQFGHTKTFFNLQPWLVHRSKQHVGDVGSGNVTGERNHSDNPLHISVVENRPLLK
ncbi:hypothetical protein OGAPHI_000831 [Ogataea philodendri]|uniref:Uncharacterized protein n=1 Tax=Ogataea philodendri TaxID=1378263 RepID=A0A9P8TA95_9ASCO|nr:uncharacterized protein OGAPHI_000831 [Ogataea philodendri]KAH3671120.1 hypothetical protein OGAPHI_000831 [Ogataea philodendri]